MGNHVADGSGVNRAHQNNLKLTEEGRRDYDSDAERSSHGESMSIERMILVLGQQCLLVNGELVLGKRYECILDHVYAVWCKYRAPVVIPAGWLGKGPIMHGTLAKRYLMEVHGMRSQDIVLYGDPSAPPGLQPARTTYEELQVLQVLGPTVVVVCESTQAPRSWLMARALGYKPKFSVLEVKHTGLPWLYEKLLQALVRIDPHERLLNWLGLIERYRGLRYPYGSTMPPQNLRR